jgi:hypothetical protein
MDMGESEIAEKVARCLTERDPFDDGEAMVAFGELSAGSLSVTCRATVRGAKMFEDLDGRYEVEVRVRRIR